MTPKDDVETALRNQGYSSSDIAEMQRILDSDEFDRDEITQMPMPILQQHARSLNIEGAAGLQKGELVDAIGNAGS